jgi:hypothetical protein
MPPQLTGLFKILLTIPLVLVINLSYSDSNRTDDVSILDVDANGEVDALTDGLLLLRSMFKLTDDALVTGVVDSANCKECDAEGIDSYITSIKGTSYGGLTPEPGPAGPQGEKGDKGDTGAQGVQGATGAQGSKGDTGDTGPAGPQGEKGEKGDTGAQGVQGATGAQGPQGATGAVGADGSDGATGPQGATGAQGPQGATGAAGADGSDGATGSTGPAGATGATGPQGATGATPYKGEWSNVTTYSKGNMVLYRNQPFWSLADSNQGTKPGSETAACSFWNSSYFAKWIGVNGYTALDCSFDARITNNDFYGQNGTTYYFIPNQNVASYVNSATVSGATLTLQQPITVTNLSLGGNIMSDSYNSQSTYTIALIVDGVEVVSLTDNLPYGPNLSLSSNLNIDIDSGSLMSIALSLGGKRFLDTTASPDGAIHMQVQYTQ